MFTRAQAVPAMVDLEQRFRVMDEFPGYRQIPSLASPPLEALASATDSPDLARIANDSMAAMVASFPDRFPSFVASLPMNNPDAALQEAERAVRQLGAAGVQVFSNVNGRPLDEPEYLAIFELMGQLGAATWLHPWRTMNMADYASEQTSKYDLWWALGWPHETSVAMGRLVFAGLFDRWPDLVVVTHHVGGVIALMEGRLEIGLEMLGKRAPANQAEANVHQLQERPVDAFRRFHADTASFGSVAAIECGSAFFGIDHLLFGTDMPFDPEGGPGYIRATLAALRQMPISTAELQKILVGNATRLFNLK
jgi:aminocarboxymuconate-semialdehyde decarboxylase